MTVEHTSSISVFRTQLSKIPRSACVNCLNLMLDLLPWPQQRSARITPAKSPCVTTKRFPCIPRWEHENRRRRKQQRRAQALVRSDRRQNSARSAKTSTQRNDDRITADQHRRPRRAEFGEILIDSDVDFPADQNSSRVHSGSFPRLNAAIAEP